MNSKQLVNPHAFEHCIRCSLKKSNHISTEADLDGFIAAWLNGQAQIEQAELTTTDILAGAFGIDDAGTKKYHSARTKVGQTMVRLGWKKKRRPDGLRLYYYKRPEQPLGCASEARGGSHSKMLVIKAWAHRLTEFFIQPLDRGEVIHDRE